MISYLILFPGRQLKILNLNYGLNYLGNLDMLVPLPVPPPLLCSTCLTFLLHIP